MSIEKELNILANNFWKSCGVKFGKKQTKKEIVLPKRMNSYWESEKIKDETIFKPILARFTVGGSTGREVVCQIIVRPYKKDGNLGQPTTLYMIAPKIMDIPYSVIPNSIKG